MNGLNFIRCHCNIPVEELADTLHVSDQMIHDWEAGVIEIADYHLTRLSDYFGIDRGLFGEITDAQKDYIMEKPMFRYIEDGKERYLYHPKDDAEGYHSFVYFFGNMKMTLDDLYEAALEKKENSLAKCDDAIRYFDKTNDIMSKINSINRGCSVYDSISSLMELMPLQQAGKRMPYFHEIISVIDALMVAHGLLEETDIREKYKNHDDSLFGPDADWVMLLALSFKMHWKRYSKEIDSYYRELRAERRKLLAETNDDRDDPAKPLTFQELSLKLEEDCREFWKHHPDIKEEGGPYSVKVELSHLASNDSIQN